MRTILRQQWKRWISLWGRRPPSAELARRVRRVYLFRQDIREALPYGLLPTQRHLYAEWLFDHARGEHDLRDEEIREYLALLEADPAHGLAETFSLTPDWQRAVPHGLTIFGWATL